MSSWMKMPLKLTRVPCRARSDSQYICEAWPPPNATSNFATSSSMLAWRKLHAMHPWCGPRRRCCRRSTGNFVKTIRPPSPLQCAPWKRTSSTWKPCTVFALNAPGQPGKFISHTLRAPKACIEQTSRRTKWPWPTVSSKPWIGSKVHPLGTGGCVHGWPCRGNWA